jgi:hypothetical protein
MVVQALFRTAKVHRNGAANIKNLKNQWCGKHFAAPTLTNSLMNNHWAEVSRKGNRIISR